MLDHEVRAIFAPDVRQRSVVECACRWQAMGDNLGAALEQHAAHALSASAQYAQLDPPGPEQLRRIAAELAKADIASAELAETMQRAARTFFGGKVPAEVEQAVELARRGAAAAFPADELAARRGRARRRGRPL